MLDITLTVGLQRMKIVQGIQRIIMVLEAKVHSLKEFYSGEDQFPQTAKEDLLSARKMVWWWWPVGIQDFKILHLIHICQNESILCLRVYLLPTSIFTFIKEILIGWSMFCYNTNNYI